jgi:hypothetical protein
VITPSREICRASSLCIRSKERGLIPSCNGKRGQFILWLSAIVFQRAVTDGFNIAFNLGMTMAVPAVGEFTDNDFLGIADSILAARI